MSSRLFVLFLLLSTIVVPLPAQKQQAARRAAVPANVEVIPDIVYATYGEQKLRLDVYLPKPRPSRPIPGIVVIRGGGWRQGDKQGFAPIAAGLAARGLAAACIEYRVIPQVTVQDAVNDSKAAVRWMRAEGKQYGINPDAIGAIGGSAGGHLVALLATSYKVAKLEGEGGHPGVSSRLQAVVPMAPVVDFTALSQARQDGGGASRTIFGDNLELAALLSPVTHLDRDSAPFLLIHSNGDKTVPIAQSKEMLERCQKTGVPADMVTIDGAPHAFWNMPQWSTETQDKAAQFFHQVLDKIR